ncbi:RNA polymerase sigma factor [Paenibacillus typhae]|uniref:RNA polymerase sigma factor n=1 Tax=Paenibacillus typhae TaxID=1174501 RepID=UPI001C8E3689|nr:sigma-70 family RNA polymerase sigma factor [Paenibacillus typhae]MBY0012417.1 sigma-70 family RNA polymerase sigma factor [Paenibacillus typhae]
MQQKYQPIYEALKAGNNPEERLWEDLISHCRCEVRRRIEHYNFTFLANEGDIERIVHDFVYALAKSINLYDPERATLKTYVNGIIDNMVKNEAKEFNKRKRDKSIEILEYITDIEGKGDPERQLLIKEEIEELYKMLRQLTAQQYEVIKLRIIDSLSVEETALILGVSTKIVSNRLNKAIEKINILKERNNKYIKPKHNY